MRIYYWWLYVGIIVKIKFKSRKIKLSLSVAPQSNKSLCIALTPNLKFVNFVLIREWKFASDGLKVLPKIPFPITFIVEFEQNSTNRETFNKLWLVGDITLKTFCWIITRIEWINMLTTDNFPWSYARPKQGTLFVCWMSYTLKGKK